MQADEIGPAGDQFGFAGPIAEMLEHLGFGRRRGIFEVFHGLCSLAGSKLAPGELQSILSNSQGTGTRFGPG